MARDSLPPPQRSLLAVPATNPRFLEKAAQSAADAVFIDLEDAVVRGSRPRPGARRSQCDTPADVAAADAMLRGSDIRLFALIESARGVAECEAIARASPRMSAMVFGPGDYSLDLGVVDGSLDTGFALAHIANDADPPSPVEIANEVFSPPAGEMIDLVHIKIARKVLERAERIAITRR